MAIIVKHNFVSAIADDPAAAAAGEILPSHWNAPLDVTGQFAVDEVTGLVSALAAKSDIGHGHMIGDVSGLSGALTDKQDALASGTNIKTINGQSVLGSGDLVIAGGSSWQSATITLPSGAGVFEWSQSITDASANTASVIDLKLAPAFEADYLEYDPEFTEIVSMVATPAAGSFVISTTFRELHSGPINLQYRIN